MFDIMMLCAGPDSEIAIHARGPGSKAVVDDLVSLLSSDFDKNWPAPDSTPSPVQPQNHRKYPRIVILDDEDERVRFYKYVLEDEYPNAEIIRFVDGDEAWSELSQRHPDLLVLDDYHPGVRGGEILRMLADRKAKFPIMFCSSSPIETLQEIVQSPVRDGLYVRILPSPFRGEECIQTIKELLQPVAVPPLQVQSSQKPEAVFSHQVDLPISQTQIASPCIQFQPLTVAEMDEYHKWLKAWNEIEFVYEGMSDRKKFVRGNRLHSLCLIRMATLHKNGQQRQLEALHTTVVEYLAHDKLDEASALLGPVV